VIESADRDGQPYRRTVGGFEFPVQAFSERPPYLGFMVQAAAVSIGGSRMIRPTRCAVFQSAPTLIGAGRGRDAGRADVGLALNLCLSDQFL